MKLSVRKINLLNSLIIIISLFLVYSNSFNNSFNWDDTYLIQNNPRIENIEQRTRPLRSEFRFPGSFGF